MRPLIVAGLAIGAALIAAAPAQADPCGYNDVRLCDPSKVYYCPSTGTWGGWLAPCSNYVVGPRGPGMPTDEND
nr:hypothetical protein [Mycobacterium sp. 1245111.1]